jgi:predicted nucleotide-binding protein
MPEKFHGTHDELAGLLQQAGITGKWSDGGGGKHEFRSREGGVLSWWPRTGSVVCQGSEAGKMALQQALTQGKQTLPIKTQGRQIFVVHGHDMQAKDQLELALHRMGLKPFVLMNSSGGGKTLIEALEGKIGRNYSADFGIVLMTPDDVGYAQEDGPDKAEPRARQNVVLETGMLLSSLTRERMAIVVKGHLEMPSDLDGIIRFGFNNHIREIVPKLCQRLNELGFDVTPQQVAEASQ